jgi:hypothetical protein
MPGATYTIAAARDTDELTKSNSLETLDAVA